MPERKVTVATAIKSVLSAENGDQVEASVLRTKLFHQGFKVTDINVKLSVLRKKGEIILEAGFYKLNRELNENPKRNTKNCDSSLNTADKTNVCHGYPPNSDVSITNKLFNNTSRTRVYERNGVPLNIMLSSVDTFKELKAGDAQYGQTGKKRILKRN